jgi:hypothetical protein
MKTKQEIFDIVVNHARMQKCKSETCISCRYRIIKPDGTVLKCFVGALISDQTYCEQIENNIVGGLYLLNDDFPTPENKGSSIYKKSNLLREILIKNNIDVSSKESCEFLSHLQNIHDGHSVEMWEQEFSEFASVHNLIYVQQ